MARQWAISIHTFVGVGEWSRSGDYAQNARLGLVMSVVAMFRHLGTRLREIRKPQGIEWPMGTQGFEGTRKPERLAPAW